MSYESDLKNADGGAHYAAKYSGSAIEVVLLQETLVGEPVVGAVTSCTINESHETLPVEEAGNDGVDEIVQGRHQGTCSIQAFWTPQWNDRLPTRQDFIGKSFVIIKRVGKNRPGEGTVLDVVTGARLSSLSTQMAARGAVTVSMEFAFERRYNGQEWADLSGIG